MISITHGPTTERVVRNSLFLLLVCGFSVAYLWDGHIGYARANAVELLKLLGRTDQPLPTADPRVTATESRAIIDRIRAGEPLSAVSSLLGDPGLRQGDHTYYLGPGGWLKVELTGDRVKALVWTDGRYSETDQAWQRRIGYVLIVVGVLVGVHWVRVLRTRLTLDETGLTIRGQTPIPWDAMTAARIDPPHKGGMATLEYAINRQERSLRLDPYIHRDLSTIVRAVCERKGFPPPA